MIYRIVPDDVLLPGEVNRLENICNGLKEWDKKNSEPYEWDYILSLYRELLFYSQYGFKNPDKIPEFKDYCMLNVENIESTDLGKKLRLSYLTEIRPSRHKSSDPILYIVASEVLYGAIRLWAEKTRCCTLEEEKIASEYLKFINTILQVGEKKYDMEEEYGR